MACLYVFELFYIQKYILLMNCLQVVHCPLVPISCDNEYYRPQLAAAAFYTIGDRANATYTNIVSKTLPTTGVRSTSFLKFPGNPLEGSAWNT